MNPRNKAVFALNLQLSLRAAIQHSTIRLIKWLVPIAVLFKAFLNYLARAP